MLRYEISLHVMILIIRQFLNYYYVPNLKLEIEIAWLIIVIKIVPLSLFVSKTIAISET